MDGTSPDPVEVFFALFESLPRQGPGSRACTRRAYEACSRLPLRPVVADLGCGGGAQALDLLDLGAAQVVALDLHRPLLERLGRRAGERCFEARLGAVQADIGRPPLAPGAFDLVWSEGALYNLGRTRAFEVARWLLKPGGWFAFTDAVWRVTDPPSEVRAVFSEDYPTMGRVDEVLADLARAGFLPTEHFELPEDAWWTDFYAVLEARLREWRQRHSGDPALLAILDQVAAEPELRRRHAATFGYEFFVATAP